MKTAFRSAAWILALAGVALGQTSVPVTPPQPDQLSYALSALNLFKTYGRDSYRTAFLQAAPACDPSKAIKTWFDSTMAAADPDSLALYKGVIAGTTGAPAIKQFWMTAAEAAVVNLPGRETYPPYVPAPTSAYIPGTGPGQGNTPISPSVLLTPAQAAMLATELNGTLQSSDFPGTVYPPDETRRQYEIVVNGVPRNAGLLLLERYSSGVGIPGHWTTAPDGELSFTPVPPPDCAGVANSRPVPVRDLLPNEIIQDGPFGAAVIRTDKQQQQAQAAGQFTAADRALLQAIAQKLGVQ